MTRPRPVFPSWLGDISSIPCSRILSPRSPNQTSATFDQLVIHLFWLRVFAFCSGFSRFELQRFAMATNAKRFTRMTEHRESEKLTYRSVSNEQSRKQC